jgi:hypothetical protein
MQENNETHVRNYQTLSRREGTDIETKNEILTRVRNKDSLGRRLHSRSHQLLLRLETLTIINW